MVEAVTKYKTDERPKRGAWAPGKYLNRCRKCEAGFVGDKRAMICADCAYSGPAPDDGLGHTATTCVEHAYGTAYRLPFQIKVF